MNKAHAIKKQKKVRGEASEIISIMAIVSCLALERRFTPQAKNRSTVLDIYKDENFLGFLKKAYAHDKDLSILARNFSTFIRVVDRVARGR